MSVAVEEGSNTEFNSVTERCDRCGARGYVEATKLDKILIFCNHHGAEFGGTLRMNGWQVAVYDM